MTAEDFESLKQDVLELMVAQVKENCERVEAEVEGVVQKTSDEEERGSTNEASQVSAQAAKDAMRPVDLMFSDMDETEEDEATDG